MATPSNNITFQVQNDLIELHQWDHVTINAQGKQEKGEKRLFVDLRGREYICYEGGLFAEIRSFFHTLFCGGKTLDLDLQAHHCFIWFRDERQADLTADELENQIGLISSPSAYNPDFTKTTSKVVGWFTTSFKVETPPSS
jgi:hypothetical protein